MSPVNVEEIKKAIGDQREETDEKLRRTQIGERDVPKGDIVYLSAPTYWQCAAYEDAERRLFRFSSSRKNLDI
ncbi:MAG: hypothetical protein H5T41_00835 [Methanomassiliicoccales archaeon]|nr:hypothetical protein [Methanomassiliicoccales archaeon]